MQQALDQRIRQRAYEIWEALGRPDGDSDQHWLRAERELTAAAMAYLPWPPAKKKSTPRKTPRQATLARARARKMAAR